MRVGYAVVLLLLFTAGCTRATSVPPASEPQIGVTQADVPPPAAKPAARATPPAKPAATPAPGARTPAPPAARTAATAPPLDLKTLEARLRGTKAIGFFTKIALKNQVDDLLDRFREYYTGKATLTMMELRRSYDLLMMKVLSLLQDEDQKLASAIVSSREAIWRLLADPTTFATLQS